LIPLGIRWEVLLTGKLSPISLISLISLFEKEFPLLVLLAEMRRDVSIGEISSWTEGLLEARRGSIFLGYYSLKDFFLVC